MNKIELLAPAKDSLTAISAIKAGADAIYIGADKFSARESAGNTLQDIKTVIDFAHQYYVKVYAAMNTLLKDKEIDNALKLAHNLADIGIDGLIIQDMGLLQMNLPDVPIIASTQTNNTSVEKVKFLEEVGFSRVILARELNLEQIKSIKNNTNIELECFVHGAICVGMSGQCYMSYALGKRSGNRGACAQPCRKKYTLETLQGEEISHNKHLLSLKDMNLSNHLEEIIDSGVTCLKIEGRLKDTAYVVNTVAYYRKLIDSILKNKGLSKASSGKINPGFEPDPYKTFNRSFTDYFIAGKQENIASITTPKSMGQYIGKVKKVSKDSFQLDSKIKLNNGDGICFMDYRQQLCGTSINKTEAGMIIPQNVENIKVDMMIYRNYDHLFIKTIKNEPMERKIGITLRLFETPNGIALEAIDEDGNKATIQQENAKEPAKKIETAKENITKQMTKFGNTIFNCTEFKIELEQIYFFPVSVLNQLRRDTIEELIQIREKNRPTQHNTIKRDSTTKYPQSTLDYHGNLLNEKANQFYLKHGVTDIDPAVETGIEMMGKEIMKTKYCIRKELNLCTGNNAESLILKDELNNSFIINFTCDDCGMEIVYV